MRERWQVASCQIFNSETNKGRVVRGSYFSLWGAKSVCRRMNRRDYDNWLIIDKLHNEVVY